MPVNNAKRAGRRPLGRRWVLGLAATLLAGCGGAGATGANPTQIPPTAAATASSTFAAEQTATAEAFGTANAQRLAAMLTPTSATPTPRPAPTSTLVPAPGVAPTVVQTPSPSSVLASDLVRWPVGSVGGQYPAKTAYDPASGAYTVALTDAAQFYAFPVYQLSESALPGVRIEVDIHRTAGPSDGAYGVVCGVQGTGEKRSGYNVLLYPDTHQFSVSWHPIEGHGQVVVPITGVPAIKQGDAVNRLQVTCKGNSIIVAVNSVTAGRYSVTQPTTGEIGLIVVAPPRPSGSTGMAAAFAHLLVSAL